mmetsp:Transcript_122410/g.212393  ORF Transcript_122410/g.212393 Transcript_122410/m.212393 type:complete len:244 (+) Transcript_122410:568-1299(+)
MRNISALRALVATLRASRAWRFKLPSSSASLILLCSLRKTSASASWALNWHSTYSSSLLKLRRRACSAPAPSARCAAVRCSSHLSCFTRPLASSCSAFVATTFWANAALSSARPSASCRKNDDNSSSPRSSAEASATSCSRRMAWAVCQSGPLPDVLGSGLPVLAGTITADRASHPRCKTQHSSSRIAVWASIEARSWRAASTCMTTSTRCCAGLALRCSAIPFSSRSAASASLTSILARSFR